MKVIFNTNKMEKNAHKSFDVFADKITKAVKKKQTIDKSAFSCELMTMGDIFEKQDKKPVLNKLSMRFAEALVNLGNENLAGVIYSFLIKFNQGNKELIEDLAVKALAIAKRAKDPVHTMARANDLRGIYKYSENQAPLYRKALFDEKRALNDIITKYSTIEKRYNTITRELKPKESYELLLADVLLDIVETIKKQEPIRAKEELMNAERILSHFEEGKLTKRLMRLKQELNV